MTTPRSSGHDSPRTKLGKGLMPPTWWVLAAVACGCGPERAERPHAPSGAETTASETLRVTQASGLRTSEAGAEAGFFVELTASPTADVTAALFSDDESEGVPLVASLVFSPADVEKGHRVVIRGVDDPIKDGDRPYRIRFAPLRSDDLRFHGSAPEDVSLVNLDDDVPAILATATGTETTEGGGNVVVSVQLATQPRGEVTVALRSSRPEEIELSTTDLHFRPETWNDAFQVVATGLDDDIDDGDQQAHLLFEPTLSDDTDYLGLVPAPIQLTNRDDDEAGIVVSAPEAIVLREWSGSTAELAVSLATRPSSDVIIPVRSSDTTEATVSPRTLLFTPDAWSVQQVVTVSGVADHQPDPHEAVRIVFEPAQSEDPLYDALQPPEVELTVQNSDPARISLDADGWLRTYEWSSRPWSCATTYLYFWSRPAGRVVVSLTTSDETEGLVTTDRLVIWPQDAWRPGLLLLHRIEVCGVDDDIDDGDQDYKLIATITESDDPYYLNVRSQLTLTNEDDDTSGVQIRTNVYFRNDVPTEAQVTLTSRPSAPVTFELVADPIESADISPQSFTFEPDAWNVPQTVWVTARPAGSAGEWRLRLLARQFASADEGYSSLEYYSSNHFVEE